MLFCVERTDMMEFHEKLQELRKHKGLTQEELADQLFVSRTAVSKWESGRGYPNIESLKAIAKFFGVTIDQLLSGDELLVIAEEDSKQHEHHHRDLVFGLLDCSVALFFLLPFFGHHVNGSVHEVSLLGLTEIAPYLRILYFLLVCGTIVTGFVTLVMQNFQFPFWVKYKYQLSLGLNISSTAVFIISSQPYAATFLFVFLLIKVLILRKKQ
jgi:transcriptional regulator with XRE-family HTH domain